MDYTEVPRQLLVQDEGYVYRPASSVNLPSSNIQPEASSSRYRSPPVDEQKRLSLMSFPSETLIDIAKYIGPDQRLCNLICSCKRMAVALTPTMYKLAIEAGRPLLHKAVNSHEYSRDKNKIKLLVETYNMDIDKTNESNFRYLYRTPLQYAASCGFDRAFFALIELNANPELLTKLEGQTLLHLAARSTNVAIVQYLLDKGHDVNAVDIDGFTPLHLVGSWIPRDSEASAHVARLLLDKGASVDAHTRDHNGDTPLHIAAKTSSSCALARVLLERGATVDSRNNDLQTPLHCCLEYEMAELLLEHGADVVAQDQDRKTPLHTAATGYMERSPRILELFLRQPADPNVTDSEGRTPLFYITGPEECWLLVEHGVDLSIEDTNGSTAAEFILSVLEVTIDYSAFQGIELCNPNDPEHPEYYCASCLESKRTTRLVQALAEIHEAQLIRMGETSSSGY